MLLIVLLDLGTRLLEQIIPKKCVNPDRRRIETAVIIQKGHHLFFKTYNYNLTIIVPVYF